MVSGGNTEDFPSKNLIFTKILTTQPKRAKIHMSLYKEFWKGNGWKQYSTFDGITNNFQRNRKEEIC